MLLISMKQKIVLLQVHLRKIGRFHKKNVKWLLIMKLVIQSLVWSYQMPRVVHKVTIVPRGRAGGYMIALPKEDQMLLSKEDMKEQLAGLMGGRVAEEIIFNSQTTGASNDFEQATQMARAMVTEYGMSENLDQSNMKEIMRCLVLKAHKNDFRTNSLRN